MELRFLKGEWPFGKFKLQYREGVTHDAPWLDVPIVESDPKKRGKRMKFRKKPVVIEATRWFRNGDHPEDECREIIPVPGDGEPYKSEGKVVRYFRRPDVPMGEICAKCLLVLAVHGWVDTLEGGHIVCPGDWIITGVKGERYPCKPDIFEATYEPVNTQDRGGSI